VSLRRFFAAVEGECITTELRTTPRFRIASSWLAVTSSFSSFSFSSFGSFDEMSSVRLKLDNGRMVSESSTGGDVRARLRGATARRVFRLRVEVSSESSRGFMSFVRESRCEARAFTSTSCEIPIGVCVALVDDVRR
jgi:hypothetical protein